MGATIQIKGTATGITSDQMGAYQLRVVQSGTVQLTASFVGSKTAEKTVTLSGNDQEINFILADDVFNLDQVVVTGTGTSRTQKEMSASLTQLSAKQIQATSPNSMADILRFIPGVHAEGGGGEVAANIFVRGLPAGGQYKYNPIEEDGMPVQATGYLTSSAQDVYFRNDLGVANLEFARGGSTSLFGMGAPLGVFNYISKKGGQQAETTVKFSGGQYNLYRMDFNHGGPAGENWTYNVSGFYRYDEGPLPTGLATKGYQIRANATRRIEGGYVRFYLRSLDDNDQFYLPIPHIKNTATAATGNDGQEIRTFNTPYAGTFGLVTPLATVQGNIGNGVTAKGNSIMLEFVKNLGNNWEIQAKTRWSKFAHTFDLFSPNKSYEIGAYAKLRVPAMRSYTYTYADNGQPLRLAQGVNENRTYVAEQTMTLRNRPMQDYSADMRVTKKIVNGQTEHNLTVGLFGSVTKQLQDEVGTGILLDFANQPLLVDLIVTDTTGKQIKVTRDGFRQSIGGRTNNSFEADRIALYVGDEMVFGKLRFDVGFRNEWQKGKVTVENTAAYPNPGSTSLADATYRWTTGKTTYREVNFNDFSFVLGTNYRLSNATNLYASFAKGVYFPEIRLFSNIARDAKGNFIQSIPAKNENVYQAEAGIKYGASRLSGTAAVYYNTIKNRLQQDVEAGTDGTLREITRSVGSTTTVGIEAAAAYQLARGWVLDAGLTLQDHRYDDFVKNLAGPDNIYGTADDTKIDYKGNWVLRQPKFMLNGGLAYSTAVWDLGVMANHVGKRYADDQNNIELPAYTLINLRANRSFAVGTRQTITIGLNLYNAFNSRGLTEGDPRVGDTNTILNDPFYNARPILPRRLTGSLTFKF